jgi:predicted hotdog family 3-hydroxylacyl-ACP dehydratase
MNKNDLISYLPHKKPILMVDEVLSVNTDSAETSYTVTPQNPFFQENGTLSEFAFIELMAQSAAIHIVSGYIQKGITEPSVGYIIGISNMNVEKVLSQQHKVSVESQIDYSMDNFHIYQCCVKNKDTIIAKGDLKIYAEVQ